MALMNSSGGQLKLFPLATVVYASIHHRCVDVTFAGTGDIDQINGVVFIEPAVEGFTAIIVRRFTHGRLLHRGPAKSTQWPSKT